MNEVVEISAVHPFRLKVRFSDGAGGVHDCSALVNETGPMVEPLKSKAYFDRVFVEMGAPTWPNGFDVDPINLYMELRNAGAGGGGVEPFRRSGGWR